MDGELDIAVDVQALNINKIARETLVNFMASHDQLPLLVDRGMGSGL
jgi:hypothetical protein